MSAVEAFVLTWVMVWLIWACWLACHERDR